MRMVEQAEQEGGSSDPDTCYILIQSEDDVGPEGVDVSAFGEAGTYGASSASITVGEEDFCTLSDGTENTGEGPDDEGKVAAFEITDTVSGTCTGEGESESTVEMLAGSSGVFRNSGGYMPEIYGTFSVAADGGEAVDVDCTIYLNEDGSVDFAECTDENGDEVEQTDATDCDFGGSEE